MSEKRFAFASVSVAIVLGVFFYPPPPPSRHAGAAVGAAQQPHAALQQARGTAGINGVD